MQNDRLLKVTIMLGMPDGALERGSQGGCGLATKWISMTLRLRLVTEIFMTLSLSLSLSRSLAPSPSFSVSPCLSLSFSVCVCGESVCVCFYRYVTGCVRGGECVCVRMCTQMSYDHI